MRDSVVECAELAMSPPHVQAKADGRALEPGIAAERRRGMSGGGFDHHVLGDRMAQLQPRRPDEHARSGIGVLVARASLQFVDGLAQQDT